MRKRSTDEDMPSKRHVIEFRVSSGDTISSGIRGERRPMFVISMVLSPSLTNLQI
jgi:hypothetical protein